MVIVRRFRDNRGITIGYTLIDNNGALCNLGVEETKQCADQITNAYITSDGEFRAKKGCHIDTVDNTPELDMNSANNEVVHADNNTEKESEVYPIQSIKILVRVKDEHDKSVKYEVDVQDEYRHMTIMTAEDVLKNLDKVLNAYAVSGMELRANKGYHIDTVIVKDALNEGYENIYENIYEAIHKVREKTKYTADYLGKGYINICRKIRKHASMESTVIKCNRAEKNEDNIEGFVGLIESFGYSMDDYIRKYLENMQPYLLSTYKNSKSSANLSKSKTIVCNMGFKIQMLISFESDCMLVSFHKNKTKPKTVRVIQNNDERSCAVIADDIIEQNRGYSIIYTDTIVYSKYKEICHADYCKKDIASVGCRRIHSKYDKAVNKLFKSIQSMDYKYHSSATTVCMKRGDNELLFFELGYNEENTVCCLIDIYTDAKAEDKMLIAGVCSEIIDKMELNRQEHLKKILTQRYVEGYCNPLYSMIMNALE